MVKLALLLALAMVLQIVDNWLPLPFFLPGIKLGLANVVTLRLLQEYRYGDALTIAIVRVVLGSIVGGFSGGPAFLLSLSGALFSWFAGSSGKLLLKDNISPLGLGVLAACGHMSAQLGVFRWLFVQVELWSLWPFYMSVAFITGIITGLIVFYWLRFERGVK